MTASAFFANSNGGTLGFVPTMGALHDGHLEGCVIICRAHGWPFDVRTGFDPDNADGFPIPCFAVEVEDEVVRLDITKQTNDPRANR